jgi:hypothetical protein
LPSFIPPQLEALSIFQSRRRVATRVSEKQPKRVSLQPIPKPLQPLRAISRNDNISATTNPHSHPPLCNLNGNTTIPVATLSRSRTHIHSRTAATATSTAKCKHISTTWLWRAFEYIQRSWRRGTRTTRATGARKSRARAYGTRTTRGRRKSRRIRCIERRTEGRNQRSREFHLLPP